MNHADRVVVLDGGHVAADGPPDQALSEAVIAQVWKVRARWLGDAGARALAII
jgi:iron complex transport system ATP-binding protein